MLKILISLLSLVMTAGLAVPKYYADYANAKGIDPDKFYAVLLAESGVQNAFGHDLPWPWSVTIDGHYYQFKNRRDLFQYLKKQNATAKITYGLAGQPIKQLSTAQLWQSTGILANLNYAAKKLQRFDCSSLAKCVALYRSNKTITSPIDAGVKASAVATIPQSNPTLNRIIAKVSAETGVEEALLHAIISRESAYKVKAKSHAGAMGLMQLMPDTAKYLGLKPEQYYSPYHNVLGGAYYIKEQLQNFNGNLDLALAAYNAGPGAVRKYNGIPPYKETKQYVPAVKGYYRYYKKRLG